MIRLITLMLRDFYSRATSITHANPVLLISEYNIATILLSYQLDILLALASSG